MTTMKKILLTISSLIMTTAAVTCFAGNAAKGKELSVTCAACHGVDGNSPASAFPNIAGQYKTYLIHSIKAYQNGERQNPIMAPMVAALSPQDIEDLAAFYSSQKGLMVVNPKK
jgi:cytochrome c553